MAAHTIYQLCYRKDQHRAEGAKKHVCLSALTSSAGGQLATRSSFEIGNVTFRTFLFLLYEIDIVDTMKLGFFAHAKDNRSNEC